MAAGIGDHFKEAFNSGNPNVARVTATRTSGGTSLSCDNLAGWPTATAVDFSTYQINTSNVVIAGTQTDWKGIVSGNTIGTLTRITGAADSGSSIGDVVEMNPTGNWATDLMKGILVQHNQDGTHAAITVTSVASTGAVSGTSGTFTGAVSGTSGTFSGVVSDSGSTLATIRNDSGFDFIVSGGVWSGDSYGSTRNGSMTALVCYQNGQRGTISAVTAHSFTASKDTYVDILNTSGTFTIVYTAVNNNVASPALAANSIRLAIIVTGASNIAASTSVNQGQEFMVLPLISSNALSVTDSLGNLICPRDPQRKLLGYRQILTTFSTANSTQTQITGLTCPVIVPTGRKVKITYFADYITATATAVVQTQAWDGVVASGTSLQEVRAKLADSADQKNTPLEVITTPTTASKTYNMGTATTAGTLTIQGSSTTPVFIKVELD